MTTHSSLVTRTKKEIAAAAFTLLPYAHLAIIIPVFIHEFIGHGLVCLADGGYFNGIVIQLDGMGWAAVQQSCPCEGYLSNWVLMGGPLSTLISGLLFIGAGYHLRGRTWLSLPTMIIAFGLVLEGIPYIFWNAVHPVPPGDIGRVLIDTGSNGLRITMILVGGLLMILSIVACTYMLFLELQTWLTDGGTLTGKNRIILALTIGCLTGFSWFVFDWNQLAPGLGMLPNIVALTLHLISAGAIIRYKTIKFQLKSIKGQKKATTIGWVMYLIIVYLIVNWFHHGVYFYWQW